jgi:O-antigen ligase
LTSAHVSASSSFTPRERAVAAVAACMLATAPWGWGGVVFWVVAATLGLGAAAFVAAWAGRRGQLVALGLWSVWLVAALVVTTQALRGSDEPGLLPLAAPAPPLHRDPWFEALAFPVAAAVGQLLALVFLGAEPSEPAAGRRLRGSWPFWAGVVFALYVAVQSWNAFGTVVERDLFWRIVPEAPWSWLPAGLRAPLRSDELDPGAMSGWRLLMILGGPWLLFCALRAAAARRRVFVLLAWVSVVTAATYALWGYLNQPSYGEILGFPIPRDAQVYGTFINRNHAGVYLYLNAGLALALAFWHLRRAGDVALRGGPHLLAAFAAIMLGLFACLSHSVGCLVVVSLLFLIAGPLAFFRGVRRDQRALRRGAWVTAAAGLVIGAVFFATTDFARLEAKIRGKADHFRQAGADDRAPLRTATWRMAADRPWTGWGAGSYRWVSPVYQAEQKALQDERGRLRVRATYAHNDPLQLFAEVGLLGLLPWLAALAWVGGRIRAAFRPGHPEAIPLACLVLFFGLHACFDLLLWFLPLLLVLAFVLAALAAFAEQSSAGRTADAGR